MNFFHGMIISLLLLLSGQFNIPRRTGATAASGNPCASVPAWTVQYVSSTLTAGTITSWPDSSGNGYTMSISGTAPAVNATDATPNGTQTVKITGAQVGTYSAGIGGNTMSICATYHLLSANLANKMTLTTINGTSGAPAYFLNALGNGPQGLDSSGVVGIGTATAIPDANWTDTCFTYNPSISSVVFYRKGSVDTTSSGGSPSTFFSNPITNFFINNGGSEPMEATFAEFSILFGTQITSTQALAYHNCMVSKYGAV